MPQWCPLNPILNYRSTYFQYSDKPDPIVCPHFVFIQHWSCSCSPGIQLQLKSCWYSLCLTPVDLANISLYNLCNHWAGTRTTLHTGSRKTSCVNTKEIYYTILLQDRDMHGYHGYVYVYLTIDRSSSYLTHVCALAQMVANGRLYFNSPNWFFSN